MTELREQIARIVNPNAWNNHDHGQTNEVWGAAPLKASLTAADEILALVRNRGWDEEDQAACDHVWVYTGTAYGGDDESYFGEGRCYCEKCGADGDA